MFRSLFQSVSDRVKSLFLTDAALSIETELIARNAQRKSELLKLADKYRQEGQPTVADDLVRQAERQDPNRPTASINQAIDYFQGQDGLLCLPVGPKQPLAIQDVTETVDTPPQETPKPRKRAKS